MQDDISIARLLRRREALDLLESGGMANGFHSKSRDTIYAKVVETVELETLKSYVRNVLQGSRQDWRFGVQLA